MKSVHNLRPTVYVYLITTLVGILRCSSSARQVIFRLTKAIIRSGYDTSSGGWQNVELDMFLCK